MGNSNINENDGVEEVVETVVEDTAENTTENAPENTVENATENATENTVENAAENAEEEASTLRREQAKALYILSVFLLYVVKFFYLIVSSGLSIFAMFINGMQFDLSPFVIIPILGWVVLIILCVKYPEYEGGPALLIFTIMITVLKVLAIICFIDTCDTLTTTFCSCNG